MMSPPTTNVPAADQALIAVISLFSSDQTHSGALQCSENYLARSGFQAHKICHQPALLNIRVTNLSAQFLKLP